MIENNEIFEDDDFIVEHLLSNQENVELIKSFSVGNSAMGLELYLKNAAEIEENEKQSRTYLVKDKLSGEIACYFSLRSGLITMQVEKESFNALSAIELSNFAMNLNYKASHLDVKKGGSYFFKRFIIPIANKASEYIGASMLYIYALPEEKLIEHYSKMGFSRLPHKQEKFVHHHVKPKYDEGCIFMFQKL